MNRFKYYIFKKYIKSKYLLLVSLRFSSYQSPEENPDYGPFSSFKIYLTPEAAMNLRNRSQLMPDRAPFLIAETFDRATSESFSIPINAVHLTRELQDRVYDSEFENPLDVSHTIVNLTGNSNYHFVDSNSGFSSLKPL